MAKGPGRRPEALALPSPSDRDLIIDAAVAAIAEQGWRRLTMAGIAVAADLPLLTVYRLFPSKTAILCGFLRRVDEFVLAAPPAGEPDERPRDRVFDLLMRRFDALQPYREALEVLSRELPRDPATALALTPRLLHSMRWMLEAADISTQGLGGIIAVKLTGAAYGATLRTWLRDDSADLGPTMATLDRRLRSVERWYGVRRSPGRTAAAEA